MTDSPTCRRLAALPVLLALALLALSPAAARADIESPVTPAEHYAGLLAQQPEGAAVVVDGAVGGTLTSEELADELRTTFDGLGLPYYVVVTPFLGAGSEIGQEIAPALHDRLGAEGVYVVLEPQGGLLEIDAYGVEADTDAARHVALTDPDLRYDDPATEVAGVVVQALQDPAAAEELQAERERLWPLREDAFEGLNPSSPDGPENVGFLVGAFGGVAVAAGGWWAWRLVRRGRPRVAAGVGVGAVLIAAGVVWAPAGWVADAPIGEHEKPDAEELARMEEPYVISTGRAARVAEALGEEPLYVAPMARLPREGLDGAAEELGQAHVPVYAAVLPLAPSDESGGDGEVLAAAVASLAQREGVYLVAGRGIGETTDVAAATYGLGADYDLSSAMHRIEAAAPAEALHQAVAALDEVELTAGGSYTPPFADQEPGTPTPRMESYWGGGVAPGLLLFGLVVVPAAIGLIWLLVYAVRASRGGGSVVGDRVLRRLAARETARLRALLARREGDLPEELLPQADAALLTMDSDPQTLDLLGVTVLARRLLAEAEDAGGARRRPCAVNPLHPWATETSRTPVGGDSNAKVCARCAALAPKKRSARVLRLSTGSTAHAYNSKPKDPWIRHRFGAENPAAMVEALLKEHHVS